MSRSHNLFLPLAVLVSLLLAACSVSFNNDLVSSHSDEIEAYSADALEHFYARRTEDILNTAAESVGFTADAIDSIYEFISETAQPDLAVAADRSFRQRNTMKLYTTVFHIPREKGREVVTITVSPDEDTCCVLYGLRLNVQIGPEYMMEVTEPSHSEDDGGGPQ